MLTKRQEQVLMFMAAGYTNKHIASELGIAKKTVDNHARTMFKKIQVKNRTEATLWKLGRNDINDTIRAQSATRRDYRAMDNIPTIG